MSNSADREDEERPPDPRVRPPLHAPPVHTMEFGHVPLAILVSVAVAWLFALAFGLGFGAPTASTAVLVLLLLIAAVPDAARERTGTGTTGTRFTVARIALTCLLAGLAIVPAGDAPDALRGSLAVAGLVAAGLESADGWLARITRSESGYSERLGALTASVLVLVLALLVWRLGIAGPWVIAAGLLALAERGLRSRRAADPATGRSRIALDLAVRAALAAALVPILPTPVPAGLAAAALVIALLQCVLTLKHVNSTV